MLENKELTEEAVSPILEETLPDVIIEETLFPEITNLDTRKRLIQILDIAEEIHPGKWDFSKVNNDECRPGDSSYKLMIHFSEIKITDGKRSHLIKDLYVGCYFNDRLGLSTSLMGCRGTVSYEEIKASYAHSHLDTSSYFEPSTFCLGDTELAEIFAKLWNNFDADLFRSALVYLYSFLPWESRDGGPYRYIENLNRKSTAIPGVPRDTIKLGISKFIETQTSFPFSIVNFGNYSKISINKDNKQFIKLITDLKVVNLILGEDGKPYGIEEDRKAIKEYIENFNISAQKRDIAYKIKFKGEHVIVKCENALEESEQNYSEVAHPILISSIASFLENELNEYLLNKNYYEHR